MYLFQLFSVGFVLNSAEMDQLNGLDQNLRIFDFINIPAKYVSRTVLYMTSSLKLIVRVNVNPRLSINTTQITRVRE